MHLHRHKKVLYYYDRGRDFRTIDCEAGSITKPRCYPFTSCAAAITSFVNGLVCVGTWRGVTGEYDDIIIWNPLTGEYKTLSRPIDTKCYRRKAMAFSNMRIVILAFELYYTCSDDDYKILSITPERNVYIYSLRSDSWRKLESTLDYEDRIPVVGDHDLLDEKLHFLRPLDEINRKYIIIRLDLETEKFTKIAIPSTCEPVELNLTVVRGCIELTYYQWESPRWTVETWQMNTNSGWMKMVNIGLLNPLSMMRDGNLIVITINGICNVAVEKNAKGDRFPKDPMCIVLPHTYIETFVSPNQFIINKGKD